MWLFWVVAAVLAVLWFLVFATPYTQDALLVSLLVITVGIVFLRLIIGRRAAA